MNKALIAEHFEDLELAGLVSIEVRALHHGKFAKTN